MVVPQQQQLHRRTVVVRKSAKVERQVQPLTWRRRSNRLDTGATSQIGNMGRHELATVLAPSGFDIIEKQ
jgi:hypothetical protein